MPRGQKKRGAFQIAIWLQDGAKLQVTSRPDRVFTNEQIAELLWDYVKTIFPLDSATKPDAVDPVGAAPCASPSTREKESL